MKNAKKVTKSDSFSFLGRQIYIPDTRNEVLNTFLCIVLSATVASMIGVILFYAYSLASMYNGNATDASLWLLGVFSDFVEIMNFSLKGDPYVFGVGASYPPIAIAILYPYALICKDVFAKYSHLDNIDVNDLTSLVAQHPEFWVAILLFFLISTLLISLLCVKIMKLDPKNAIKLTLIISFSAPFVYAIMRGNTIYFALIFTLAFLLLYRSKRVLFREVAYFCLALAGAIKLYPLFFGVFLLKDKRILASIRVAIYFSVIFFSSFTLFSGNSEGTDPFVENLHGFMSDSERLLGLRNLSLASLLYKTVYIISPSAADSAFIGYIILSVLILFFAVSTVTAIISKSDLTRAVICSAVVVLIPPISYFYILIFEIIPFMEYLKNYDILSRCKRISHGLMFLLAFFTPFIIPQIYIPYTLAVIAISSAEQFSVIKAEMLPRLFNKKHQRQRRKED